MLLLRCCVVVAASKKKRVDAVGANGTDSESSATNKNKEQREEESASPMSSSLSANVVPEPGQTGFDKGFDVEKILGASETDNELYFLLKFKEADQAEMVPATVVNVKVPQMVIKFYEERLSWYSDSEE